MLQWPIFFQSPGILKKLPFSWDRFMKQVGGAGCVKHTKGWTAIYLHGHVQPQEPWCASTAWQQNLSLPSTALSAVPKKSFRSYNAKQTWAEIKAYICAMCVMGTIHGRTIGSDIQVCRAFAVWFRTLICPDRKFFFGKLEPEKTSEFHLTQLQSFPATCISLFFFSTSGLCDKIWECISLTHWSQELCQADCQ